MCRRFAEIGGRVCEVLITVAVVLVCSVAQSTIQLSEKGSETETGCHCKVQLLQRDELNAFWINLERFSKSSLNAVPNLLKIYLKAQ